MADGIRGKNFDYLPLNVQKGIILHRFIDTFTDAHPIFRQSTKRLHSRYHHYSGVIVDLYYDHFLAKNWQQYSNEDLEVFVSRFYQSLEVYSDILTEKTKQIKPYMIAHNWLVNYQNTVGIARILRQMDRRTNDVSMMQYAIEELQQFYIEFESEFTSFFSDLKAAVDQKLQKI